MTLPPDTDYKCIQHSRSGFDNFSETSRAGTESLRSPFVTLPFENNQTTVFFQTCLYFNFAEVWLATLAFKRVT